MSVVLSRSASELVLPESALPSGYRLDSEGTINAFEVVAAISLDTERSSAVADYLLKQGMTSSYARSFANLSTGKKWITSLVVLFRDGPGARNVVPYLSDYAREHGCATLPIESRVGDVSAACYGEYMAVSPGQDGVRISITTLVFSFANAVSNPT